MKTSYSGSEFCSTGKNKCTDFIHILALVIVVVSFVLLVCAAITDSTAREIEVIRRRFERDGTPPADHHKHFVGKQNIEYEETLVFMGMYYSADILWNAAIYFVTLGGILYIVHAGRL